MIMVSRAEALAEAQAPQTFERPGDEGDAQVVAGHVSDQDAELPRREAGDFVEVAASLVERARSERPS